MRNSRQRPEFCAGVYSPALTVTVVPPDSATVRWNDQPLTLLDETRGLFQVAAP